MEEKYPVLLELIKKLADNEYEIKPGEGLENDFGEE